MPPTPAPSSLFDTQSMWRSHPEAALDALLESGRFHVTSRAPAAQPKQPAGSEPRPMGEASVKVYRTMFCRYVRHLRSRTALRGVDFEGPVTVLDAEEDDVGSFLTGELVNASRETLWRYVRLLERVHEHLVHMGWRPSNPVSRWMREHAFDGTVREMMASRRSSTELVVDPATVAGLRAWLAAQSHAALVHGDWRRARDLTLAGLSLGTGLRFTELAKLRRRQVRVVAAAGEPQSQTFELEVPGWASVATARPHRVFAAGAEASSMASWWAARWSGAPGLGAVPGELVFPATLSGKPISASTLYKNFAVIGQQALEAGVLTERSSWVMCSGAQGLRRAYVLSELAQGREHELLTERLGHWHQRSVRKYDPAAALAAALAEKPERK